MWTWAAEYFSFIFSMTGSISFFLLDIYKLQSAELDSESIYKLTICSGCI